MLKPTAEFHDVNGLLVVEFWDCLRLDANAVQSLRTRYDEHLRAGNRPEIVIDLLGVAYAGSAALGHFVALHRNARQKGGRLVFCNVDPTVFEVFRVSKLDPLFTFCPDRDAALAAAAAPEAPAGTTHAAVDGLYPAASERKSASGGLLRSSQRRKLS